MSLNFGCAEGKIICVAGYLLVSISVRNRYGDIRCCYPAPFFGCIIPCEGRLLYPATHNPLDGRGRVGVGGLTGQGHTVVDPCRSSASNRHLVRSN